ncbi:3,4-dihydroxy-2-butanone-4-phosphate synthase [Telmatospirillum sp.]|uniref:3,4-dihydroxy-2-butanone-4-phosphate synthase n=1 Tax=Telmatospirillum sp. TaxID=2079197 RepID=UPI00284DEAA1|nr:3,4-dihydroxy-2-butanone-4-phosphate synthase [Telmatospirillum sp.]MDR3435887.1 3,4-dihydroxy-2-butanone-4-phosphate synthase [Telmatospirillum sp.]
MNQILNDVSPLFRFGTPEQRVLRALDQIRQGGGVIVADDEDRENEGDIIFPAETITPQQMALLIRECSGIVCLVLSDAKMRELDLPPMVENNTSHYGTAFSVTIEAKEGVTTGVSAADRVTTIRAAIADNARPEDLARPGHVFPLRAHPDGILGRRGHTEATLELMIQAGRKPVGVLCELTNEDGTMARLPQLADFAVRHGMPMVTIEDLVAYRESIGNHR